MEITEEIKKYLRLQDFAVLCLAVDLGQGEEGLVVVKTTGSAISALRQAEAKVNVGWLVDGEDPGPVVCMVVRTETREVGELVGEVYFDPGDPADQDLMGTVAGQGRLQVVFLDEELEPAWLTEAPWDEVRRLAVDQVRDRSAQLLGEVPDYDFGAARDAFQDRYTLDEMVTRLGLSS